MKLEIERITLHLRRGILGRRPEREDEGKDLVVVTGTEFTAILFNLILISKNYRLPEFAIPFAMWIREATV